MGAPVLGEAENTGTDGWKCNGFHAPFTCALKAVEGCVPQLFVLVALAVGRANCMNHVGGLKIAASGNDGLAHPDRAYPVALLLNAGAPFGPDGASNAAP